MQNLDDRFRISSCFQVAQTEAFDLTHLTDMVHLQNLTLEPVSDFVSPKCSDGVYL